MGAETEEEQEKRGTGKEGDRKRGRTEKEGKGEDGEQDKREQRREGNMERGGTGMGTERIRAGKAWEQVSSRDGDRVGTVPTWSDVSIPAGGHGTVLWS